MSAVSSESHQPADPPRQGTAPEPAHGQADFGANEWLVEELYQRYLADPGSVDRAWWSFFADYQPTLPNGTPQPQAQPQAPAPAPAPAPPAQQAPPAAPAAPAAPPRPAPPSPAPPPPAVEGAEVSRLRGAAARTVSNMTASLAVPTATSVRAVPAKLLVDNRIVINNHLRRGRGGKVSFTHLIGYALVKALREFPVMNRSFAEADGKPTVVEHEHINLGLAIDLQKD